MNVLEQVLNIGMTVTVKTAEILQKQGEETNQTTFSKEEIIKAGAEATSFIIEKLLLMAKEDSEKETEKETTEVISE